MSFFRLRFINTLLLFFIGLVLGFIIKDRFYPAAAPVSQEIRQDPLKPLPEEASPAVPEDDISDETYPEPEGEPETPAGPVSEAETAAAGELVIEPAVPSAGLPAVAADVFFARPSAYAGRELEMELQMITARKASSGWRINLVYSSAARKLDYLYVDDAEVLGLNPDLRIGYVYKVRFLCGKGETASGNTLLAIEHTGAKADWATGLSALE